jgi:hypothetical protein
MSAYEPTRRPGGEEPLAGALPDEVALDDDALDESDEEGEPATQLADPEGESGEEQIDGSGRNPTQRKIDEEEA